MRGSTPLHIAVQMKSVELVACILEQPQVDVNRPTWDGVTALDFAILIGSTTIESILRQASGVVQAESADYDDIDDDESDTDIEQVNDINLDIRSTIARLAEHVIIKFISCFSSCSSLLLWISPVLTLAYFISATFFFDFVQCPRISIH